MLPDIDSDDILVSELRIAGIKCSSFRVKQKLNSEKDLNFLCVMDKELVVLKIFNSAMNEDDVILQLRAQTFASSIVRTPRVLFPDIDVDVVPKIFTNHMLAITEYVPGELLSSGCDFRIASCEFDNIMRKIGRLIAELNFGFARICLPARREKLIWNFTQFDAVVVNLGACLDPAVKSEFAELIPDVSQALQNELTNQNNWQLCHYDCNDDNILVTPDGEIGIIDFGDVDLGPRVTDIALSCCYVLVNVFQRNSLVTSADVRRTVGSLLGGFRTVVEISETEQRLVGILVVSRAIMSICIQSSQRVANPSNAEYLSVSFEGCRKLLAFVRSESLETFIHLFSFE